MKSAIMRALGFHERSSDVLESGHMSHQIRDRVKKKRGLTKEKVRCLVTYYNYT